MCLILNHQSMGHCHWEIPFVSYTSQCRSLLLKFWRIFPVKAFCQFKIWYLCPWLGERLLSQKSTISISHNLSIWFLLRAALCVICCRRNELPIQGSRAKLWKRAMIVTWLQPFSTGFAIHWWWCLYKAPSTPYRAHARVARLCDSVDYQFKPILITQHLYFSRN